MLERWTTWRDTTWATRLRWVALGAALLGLLSLAGPLPEAATSDYAPVSLRITDRTGHLLREVRPAGRGHPVALDAVAPAAIGALLATEDRRIQ